MVSCRRRLMVVVSCSLTVMVLYPPVKVYVKNMQVSPHPWRGKVAAERYNRQQNLNLSDSSVKTEEPSSSASRYTTTATVRLTKMKCTPADDTKRLPWDDNTTTEDDLYSPYISNIQFTKVTKVIQSDNLTLYVCNIHLKVDPCSCTRTIEAHLLHPCPTNTADPDELLQQIKSSLGESNCGDFATLRGGGQKVVSYSVYGKFPNDYYQGMEELLPRLRQVYPDWSVRVFLDISSTSLQNWVCSLVCEHPHLDVCNVRQLPMLGDVSGSTGRVWRFSVVGDALVSHYMIRDSDSPVLQREVDAVDQWLKSHTCYHIMRDNIYHSLPMLAGMWGGCNTWRVEEAIEAMDYALCHAQADTADQEILKSHLWPVARLNATVHDSYTCRRFGKSLPFPSQRVNFTFVGQRSYRRMHRRERTYIHCPLLCRPKEHHNWLYC